MVKTFATDTNIYNENHAFFLFFFVNILCRSPGEKSRFYLFFCYSLSLFCIILASELHSPFLVVLLLFIRSLIRCSDQFAFRPLFPACCSSSAHVRF